MFYKKKFLENWKTLIECEILNVKNWIKFKRFLKLQYFFFQERRKYVKSHSQWLYKNIDFIWIIFAETAIAKKKEWNV
jgi:hypothetical protein